mmetsp:Transcript_15119/g.30727  ORF Transcript_15119/g.30727 Transcript_15119/m.30727 type:complete len:178 (-) Transcript_15119:51-584(-)|eukprot:scaffold14974_cov195-Amphora_coffeaeformis.AAC.14
MRILAVLFASCLALLQQGQEVAAFVPSSSNHHKLKGGSKATTAAQPRPPTVRSQTTALHAVAKKKKAAAKTSKKAKADKKEVVTVKKSEIVAQMADQCGLTKTDTERALNAFLDVVQDNVAEGKKVALVGFGSFTLKDRAARKGRNPQTGEELDIPASKSPGFSAGKNWKDRCNGKV